SQRRFQIWKPVTLGNTPVNEFRRVVVAPELALFIFRSELRRRLPFRDRHRRSFLFESFIRPSGRALWIAGSAERSFGSPFKIQRKSQGVLNPLHYPFGKPANLAFETHSRQGS